MKQSTLKIPPNKENVFIFLVGSVISCALMAMGYKGNPPITIHPSLLLLLAMVALFFEIRFVYLEQKTISVHYLFGIKRNIPLVRVRKIEFVSQKGEHYLVISLDNCPSFYESGQSIRDYAFRHPIKLIVVPITEKQAIEYARAIKDLYPNAAFVETEEG